MANKTVQTSTQNTSADPQPGSEGKIKIPPREGSSDRGGERTQPINAQYCLRVVYQSAKADFLKRISSLITRKTSFRYFRRSVACKIHKGHLLVCRTEMAPRLNYDRMKPMWFVCVTISWLSKSRVRLHKLTPQDPFHNEEMAIENGFRLGELWVDQQLSGNGRPGFHQKSVP